ncbi:MAG: T9SS type A sorting domain-containing protein [Bacteroidaceae bacterium]|nr:T9SS type A sorting domain-containing protein [Bacteroidaceae bacterium]
MLCDSKNRLWLADRRFAGEHRGGVLCYDQEADKAIFRNEFINEDGASLSINEVFCIAEEHEGHFWVGTNAGLLVIERPDEWFNEDFLITQIKVPRNDGTNYADYLLAGVGVTTIAVDGANRKWIGTQTDGIYLVSADGTETLHHFTSENSPLLSNYIYSIAIDGNSGEVFIATDRGLLSYGGTATDPTSGLSQSNLHIYPNPLRPDGPGQINIHGLTADAEVKIISLSGQVVNRGKSIGGAYQWDATDMRGNPCASGVYIVAVSTEDGKTAVAGKFAIVR